MKKKSIILLLFCSFSFYLNALTVKSVLNDDWTNPLTWNTGQVPINPDTIIIEHYITFSSNLIIPAPTVLMIDSIGTLCGDFQLDIACGAKALNYGNIFVNNAIIRDMINYNLFWAKNYVTIYGCSLSGFGAGFLNTGANATTMVWPPVLCKTSGTNWIEGVNIKDNDIKDNVSIYPNPFEDFLVIEPSKYTHAILKDLYGNTLLIKEISCLEKNKFDVSLLRNGVYIIELKNETEFVCKKIIRR